MKRYWLNKESVFAIIFLLVCIGLDFKVNADNNKQAQIQRCSTLSPQAFLSTVNQWRVAKGIAQLQYSTELQNAARDHETDMVKNNYYGHTNPISKTSYPYFIRLNDSAASLGSEVLDGPESLCNALPDFKNSPEHYQTLMNPDMHYLGMVAVSTDFSPAVYDLKGNLTTPAGIDHPKYIVLADLADKIDAAQ